MSAEEYVEHPTTDAAMKAVMRDLGVIEKSRTSEAGGRYKFRGIEELLEAIAPLTRKHGLLTTTTVGAPIVSTYQAGSGGKTTMNHVMLPVEVHFRGGADGSVVVSGGLGEAADAGDKAVSKAYSVGFREIMFKTFTVPTRGDDYDTEGKDVTRVSDAEMAEQREAAELAHVESQGWASVEERDAAFDALRDIGAGGGESGEWVKAWAKARGITRRTFTAALDHELNEVLSHAKADGNWKANYSPPAIEVSADA